MKLKFCGIRRPEDVAYVNEVKPDFAGFIFANTRRKITLEQAVEFRFQWLVYLSMRTRKRSSTM